MDTKTSGAVTLTVPEIEALYATYWQEASERVEEGEPVPVVLSEEEQADRYARKHEETVSALVRTVALGQSTLLSSVWEAYKAGVHVIRKMTMTEWLYSLPVYKEGLVSDSQIRKLVRVCKHVFDNVERHELDKNTAPYFDENGEVITVERLLATPRILGSLYETATLFQPGGTLDNSNSDGEEKVEKKTQARKKIIQELASGNNAGVKKAAREARNEEVVKIPFIVSESETVDLPNGRYEIYRRIKTDLLSPRQYNLLLLLLGDAADEQLILKGE